jgi:hypothetical protein
MNLRKGFIRLWSFLSVCWIVFIFISSPSSLNFDRAFRYWRGTSPTQTAWTTVDISNPDAAIIMIGDRKLKISRDAKLIPFEKLDKNEQQETVEEIANKLQISHSQMASLDAVSARYIQSQLSVTFLPPIIMLIFGVSAGWVVNGFMRKQ